MKLSMLFALGAMFALTGCGTEGQEGDACTTDADCAEGLECHVHEHEEGEEEEEEHEEEGMCEAHEDE